MRGACHWISPLRYIPITVDLNLRGKVAVVTGASKGIGLAITKALVAEGGCVIAGARDVGGELGALASREAVRAVSIDLSAPDGPQALVAHAEEFGGLDILVNNVGAVAVRLEGFASVTDDQWLSSLNLNFMAAVRTTRAALTLAHLYPQQFRQNPHATHNLFFVQTCEAQPQRIRQRSLHIEIASSCEQYAAFFRMDHQLAGVKSRGQLQPQAHSAFRPRPPCAPLLRGKSSPAGPVCWSCAGTRCRCRHRRR